MPDIFDLFKRIEKKPAAPLPPVRYVIAGLGNPGKEYTRTRHNAGFLALDFICAESGAAMDRAKFNSVCGELNLGDCRALLMKPQTFMNESGTAVRDACDFYKLPPENLIVIVDDAELDTGTMRIRTKGTDGGHNGLKSIIYQLSSDNFTRIRLGVGKRPSHDYDLADWVLSGIPECDYGAFKERLADLLPAIKLIASGKTEEAMSRYNHS